MGKRANAIVYQKSIRGTFLEYLRATNLTVSIYRPEQSVVQHALFDTFSESLMYYLVSGSI